MIRKFGAPEKIKVIKKSFKFDTQVVLKMLEGRIPKTGVTLPQLHNILHSLGIIDYTTREFNLLIKLLQQTGVNVSN